MATGAQAVRNETNQAVFRLAASAIGGRRGALPATDPMVTIHARQLPAACKTRNETN